MTPVELAKLWQDGLREAYGDGQRWDAFSEQQKAINTRVAAIVLDRITVQREVAPSLESIDARLQRLEDELAKVKESGVRTLSGLDQVFVAVQNDRGKILAAYLDAIKEGGKP